MGGVCVRAELATIFLSVSDVENLVLAPPAPPAPPAEPGCHHHHTCADTDTIVRSSSFHLAEDAADTANVAGGVHYSAADSHADDYSAMEDPGDSFGFVGAESDGCGGATSPRALTEPADLTQTYDPMEWIKARQGKGGLRCRRKGTHTRTNVHVRTRTHRTQARVPLCEIRSRAALPLPTDEHITSYESRVCDATL